jgi:hypothetical protein
MEMNSSACLYLLLPAEDTSYQKSTTWILLNLKQAGTVTLPNVPPPKQTFPESVLKNNAAEQLPLGLH